MLDWGRGVNLEAYGLTARGAVNRLTGGLLNKETAECLPAGTGRCVLHVHPFRNPLKTLRNHLRDGAGFGCARFANGWMGVEHSDERGQVRAGYCRLILGVHGTAEKPQLHPGSTRLGAKQMTQSVGEIARRRPGEFSFCDANQLDVDNWHEAAV